jgi:hypothetical protein
VDGIAVFYNAAAYNFKNDNAIIRSEQCTKGGSKNSGFGFLPFLMFSVSVAFHL